MKNMFIYLLIIAALISCPRSFCFAMDVNTLDIRFLQGNFREVVSEGEALLRNASYNDQQGLNKLMGFSCLKINRPQEAKKYFQEFLRLSGKGGLNDEAKIGLADAFLASGDLDNAKRIYRAVLEADSGSKFKAAIFYRLGKIASRDGDNDKANEYLARLKNEYPFSLELKSQEGLEYFLTVRDEDIIYTVQAGYFSNSVNAENFRKKLLAKGYPAYLQCSSGTCRVRVGKFNRLKDAVDLQNKLSRDGFATKVFP